MKKDVQLWKRMEQTNIFAAGIWSYEGDTVNQHLFVTTLFCDLSKKNWFAVINFRDLNVDYLKI